MTRTKITLMAIFALSGFSLSVYLFSHHYQIRYGEGYESACNFGQQLDCDAVALHPTAEIMGIPVAGLGLVFYIMVFYFLFKAWRNQYKHTTRLESYFISILCAGIIMDIYFLWISIQVIHSLCPFCAVTYAANLFIFIIALDFGFSWKKIIPSLKLVFTDLGWGH